MTTHNTTTFSKTLIATLTILFFVGLGTAVQDTVTIHESAQGSEISHASDGQEVFVKVDVSGSSTSNTQETVTVSSPDSGSDITVNVYDDATSPDNNADDGVYWGSFVVDSSTIDDGQETIQVTDTNDATVTADLDGDSSTGTDSITADYTAPSLDSGTTVQAGTQNSGTSKIDVTFTEAGSGLDSSTIDPSDFSIAGTTIDGDGGDSVSVDGNTVTITYDASTTDISDLGTGDTPDVGVAGSISDNAGNTVSSGSTTTNDGISPVVESISFSQDPISDSNTDQTVTVTYSEQMDTNQNPTINFNGVSTISSNSASWTGGNEFSETYTVEDGVDVNSVSVDVSGAQDDSTNNLQVEITDSSNTFDVDRVNPSISNAEVTAPQEVTVTFNENVYASSGSAGQDGDDLVADDFAYQDDNSGGATDVSSVTQGSSHSEWVLTLDAPVENADLGQDDITLGDSVFDSVANELTTSAASTVVVDDSNTDDVEPTVTNFDTTVSGSDITIHVDSDESLSNIDVSAEGGTVSNSDFEDTGTNEYEATYTPGSDGTYTVTLNSVTDGTNQVTFSSRTSDSTVDQNGPTGSNFNPADDETTTDSQKQITVELSDAGTSVSSVDSVTLTDGSSSVIGGINGVTTSNEHVSTSGSDPVSVTIDPSATGGDGSSFTYPEGTVNVDIQATDGSSNSNTVSYDFTVDTEAPSITSATTQTTDKVQVTISDETSNIDTATIDAGHFQVDGSSVSISSSFGSNSGSVTGTLQLDSGSFSTGATPDVSIVSGSSGISDVPGNTVNSQTFSSTTDGVAPVAVSGAFSDQDQDGKVDQATLTFSEDIQSPSSLEAGDFTVSGTDSSVLEDSSVSNPTFSSSDTVQVDLTEGSIDTALTDGISLDYTASAGTDDSITDGSNPAPDTSSTLSDNAAPKAVEVKTFDQDSDGKTDATQIEFSEAVDDSTVSSNPAYFEIGQQDAESFSTNRIDGTSDEEADDQFVSVTIDTDSNEVSGTELKQVDYTDSALQDMNSNNFATADDIGLTKTDAAAPVLEFAEIDHSNSDSSNTFVLSTFSESVNTRSSPSISTDTGASVTAKEQDGSNSDSTLSIKLGSVIQTGDNPEVTGVSSLDDDGGNTPVLYEGSNVEIDTFRKDLSSGWNFVSFPIAGTSSPDVSSVLGDTSNVNAVWRYTSDGWESWTPSSSNEDDFSTVSGGEGYLVDVDTGYTIDPNVNNVQTTEAPAQVQLSEGYNLVGQFQEFHQDASADDGSGAFASLDSSFWKVSEQTSGLQVQETTAGDGIKTGSAYWVQTQGDLSDGSIAYTAN